MMSVYVYVYLSLDEVDVRGCVCGFMILAYVYLYVSLDEAFVVVDIDDVYACVL